jgi:outer membrane protein assembly factor BamB
MKTKSLLLIIGLVALGLILSACVGGAGQTTSWPGLTVDPDGEVAYLANGQQVYAVNLTNCSEKWHFPQEGNNKVTFYAAPALTDDGQLIVGGYDGVLYSLNPDNGQQNWKFEGSEDRYIAVPLANGEFIYAPSSDTDLYTLDLKGNLQWEFSTEEALWGEPATDGIVVYLPGMDHVVYALDAQTGSVIWQTEPLGGSVAGNPTLSPDGQLFVGTYANELLSLDSENGQILWRMPAANWVWSGAAQDGETLYVGDVDGNFLSVNADSGSIQWKIQPDPDNDSAIVEKPIVLNEIVYFTAENGTLYAVDAANGNQVWSREVGGKLFAGPKTAGETILVAPMGIDELLVAFDPNGNQKCVFVPAD